jgi:thioredoxin 2
LHGAVNELSVAELWVLIEKSIVPVVVDFWAPWCQPCKAFAPVFEQTARSIPGQVVFAKIDTQAHPAAAENYGIRGIPTLILFRNGREITRQSGAMPLSMFTEWLKGALRPQSA